MTEELRKRKLAALHIAKNGLGLDEDTYRDRLQRVTGKRSAAELDDAGLDAALADFGNAQSHVKHFKRNDAAPYQTKIRAMWIGLWNLGCIDAGTDESLDAFVLRQCGKERLVFVGVFEAAKVTEALKAIASRDGWDIPAADPGGMIARRNLVRAQWSKLHRYFAVQHNEPGALASYGQRGITECRKDVEHWKRHELDKCAKKLGYWLRRVMERRAEQMQAQAS